MKLSEWQKKFFYWLVNKLRDQVKYNSLFKTCPLNFHFLSYTKKGLVLAQVFLNKELYGNMF